MMQKHTIPTLARALSAPRRAQGRVTCLFWAVMTTLLWPLLAASDPAAQTLSEALCPTPPPYDFILEPPLTPWVPGMAGIPMLKRTLNDAVCNDGSAGNDVHPARPTRPTRATRSCTPSQQVDHLLRRGRGLPRRRQLPARALVRWRWTGVRPGRQDELGLGRTLPSRVTASSSPAGRPG